MPPRTEPGLRLIIPQPKTKAQAVAECLKTLFCCGSDASSTSKACPQAGRPGATAEHVGFSGRIEQAAPYSSGNVPRLDGNHLEGTSIPIAGQRPKSASKTTVNNTGAFLDSNLSHINQGNYNTVNQGSISGGTFVSGNVNVNENGLSGLNLLKKFVAFDALHDSSAQDPKRQCHPGTRENVLKTMRNWIDDPNAEEKIFWLHGPAGVGKSAISQTISHSYKRDKVAATFFFFRSDPNRNDGYRLFPTLAWQLAFSIPNMKNFVVLALNENPDLPRKTIEIQFERLIVQPLQTIAQSPQVQTPVPVIIVDGVDECSDNDLQRRFLDTLGKAALDSQLPLRFLISSRPEAHIRECFNRFQCSALQIDLANTNEAFRDIEKYLITEFARIASDHGIDPETWPGQTVIDDLVKKSSGQFVYVVTIIKFVGDEYEVAKSQLNIILGLKPSDGKSPFADLDALYMEILQRQRHQEFLMEFLAIFIGHSRSRGFSGRDDALLLETDEKVLHRKLRGMHSLLKIEPGSDIDVHHRSFIDFLLDPRRSGRYHISEHSGKRRFFELIVDTLVRHASKVIKEPNYHGSEHFAPQFASAIRQHTCHVGIPLGDWEEALRPLLSLREEMLKFPNSYSPWKRGLCDGCSIFYTIDDLLLHLLFLRGNSLVESRKSEYQHSLWYSRSLGDTAMELVDDEPRGADGKQRNCVTSRTPEGGQHLERANPDSSGSDPAEAMAVGVKWTSGTIFDQEGDNRSYEAKELCSGGLDSCLTYLLAILRNRESDLRLMAEPVQRLLNLDYAETVSKLRSISDAQNLLDLIFYMIQSRSILIQCGPEAMHRALQLALEIYARIPLIPQSLFLNGVEIETFLAKHSTFLDGRFGIFPMCQIALVWGTLSHENVIPLLGISDAMTRGRGKGLEFVYPNVDHMRVRQWRREVNPSQVEIRDRMLEVARAAQYIHSLGLVFLRLDWASGGTVFIDSNLHAKIQGYGISPQYLRDTPSCYIAITQISLELGTYEFDIFRFGYLYYETYFNVVISEFGVETKDRKKVAKRPAQPEIHDDVWSLIQRCCAEDTESRPTMDEIVEEMESWRFS